MVNGIKVIDAHCHIYPEKIAERAVAGTDNFYKCQSFCKGTVSDLLSEGEKAGIDHFIVQSVATTPKQVKSINDALIPEVGKWYTLLSYCTREISYSSKYSYNLIGAGTIEVQGLYVAYPRTANLGSLNWNGEYFTGYIPFKGEKIQFEQISNTNSPPLYEQRIVNGVIQMWNGSYWVQISNV